MNAVIAGAAPATVQPEEQRKEAEKRTPAAPVQPTEHGKTEKRWYKEKNAVFIVLALLLLTIAVRAVAIDRPYEAWDEMTTYSIGLKMWYNIARGDFSQPAWGSYTFTDFAGSYHPPLARYVYGAVNGIVLVTQAGPSLLSLGYEQAVQKMVSLKSMLPGRILSILFAAGTVALVFLFARRRFGLHIAVAAAAILALLPAYVAHTRLETLDAMLTFLYTLSVILFIRGLEQKKYLYYSFLAVALTVATKYNSVSLFILLPLLFVAVKRPTTITRRHILHLTLLVVIPLLTLVVIWPRLWPNPLVGLPSSFLGWQAIGSGDQLPEYFLGQLGTKTPLYEIVHLLASTPVVVLLLFAAGLITFLKDRKPLWPVVLWLIVPLLLFAPFGVKTAGTKNIMMVYPAFALLAAVGLNKISAALPKKNILQGALPLVIVAYLLASLAAVSPYYLEYYNEAVGGPKEKLFGLGQAGDGIDAAAYYLNKNAAPNASVQFFVRPKHVIPPLRPDLQELNHYVPRFLSALNDTENWDMAGVLPEADYLVENLHFRLYMNESFHQAIGYQLVHTVEVQGAPLAWVYAKKEI